MHSARARIARRHTREAQARSHEVQAQMRDRIAELEGEVAQMRPRCVLLDEMAGKMASLCLVQIANRERDAAAAAVAGSASGSNMVADEGKTKDARIAELERVVAKDLGV